MSRNCPGPRRLLYSGDGAAPGASAPAVAPLAVADVRSRKLTRSGASFAAAKASAGSTGMSRTTQPPLTACKQEVDASRKSGRRLGCVPKVPLAGIRSWRTGQRGSW